MQWNLNKVGKKFGGLWLQCLWRGWTTPDFGWAWFFAVNSAQDNPPDGLQPPVIDTVGVSPMRLTRWLVNFLTGTIFAFVSFYFVISICIFFFKLTGLVSDGPMYFEMQTPTYAGLLRFQAISIAIISACFAVRITFGQKNDFSFVRGNRKRERTEWTQRTWFT